MASPESTGAEPLAELLLKDPDGVNIESPSELPAMDESEKSLGSVRCKCQREKGYD